MKERVDDMSDSKPPDAIYLVGSSYWQADPTEGAIRYVRDDGWHPASEPPDTERGVLTTDSLGGMTVGGYCDGKWIADVDWAAEIVTHWRELPQPPELSK